MKLILYISFLTLWIIPLIAQQTPDYNQIEELLNNKEYDKVRNQLMRAYTEDDENPQTNFWLARLALADTLYDEAIDYLDVAIEGDEKNADYYFWLGMAYSVKAQNAGAISGAFAAPKIKSNWEEALELDPTHMNARWGLYQFLMNAPGIIGGDKEEAKNIAGKYVVQDPGKGHFMLANYYWQEDQNLEKTEREIRLSLGVESDDEAKNQIHDMNTSLLNQLGYHFLGEKDYKHSKKYFKWAIRLSPDKHNPYDSMGDHFTSIAVYDSALICYEKALSIKPDFEPSKFNKGQILEKLGKTDQAIPVYHELILESPESRYAEQAEERLSEIE